MSDSFRLYGLYSPWNSLSQNTGVGSLSLLQVIFPTQGSNPGLPHWRIICQLSYRMKLAYKALIRSKLSLDVLAVFLDATKIVSCIETESIQTCHQTCHPTAEKKSLWQQKRRVVRWEGSPMQVRVPVCAGARTHTHTHTHIHTHSHGL